MNALRISLLALIMTFGLSVNAQKLVNVQNGTKSLFFETLDEAMGEAVSGDTIYLPGATVQVTSSLIIDKKLAIVGAGYDADSIGGLLPTRIMTGNYSAEINFRNGSDGSMLTGCSVGNIKFGHYDNSTNHHSIKDVLIWRNSASTITLGVNTGNSISHIAIKENILSGYIEGYYAQNCIISNNTTNSSNYSVNRLKNSQIENNVFRIGVYNIEDCTIENNYFKSSSGVNYVTNSTFRNNVSASTGSASLPTDAANPGNLNGVAMADVFEDGANASTPAGYRIKAGSVCEKAGTDGTDIGIFGGSSPFKMGGKPFNPHIDRSVISVETDTEGKLKIDIQVSAQER